MLTKLIAATMGVAPLTVLGLMGMIAKPPLAPFSTDDCGCSVNPTEAPLRAPLSPLLPECPEGLSENCTLQSTSEVFWCKSGGVFFTCETTGDNDSDGIFGELHFWMHRYDQYYQCYTGNYIVCGDWQPAMVPGQSQQKCCSNTTEPPACPPGSCQY
jgi:hypothetical protein